MSNFGGYTITSSHPSEHFDNTYKDEILTPDENFLYYKVTQVAFIRKTTSVRILRDYNVLTMSPKYDVPVWLPVHQVSANRAHLRRA
ncbi:hypothetical protein TNCV_3876481 [Trichonephila clavipes]|uniref:Uncharacterized protein n=1 Tax=Trichonephila clavipes TaxID=2585209 RepID=A0A8X6SX36_TRICX|nr:hypothetical protein TNCV_3876481 [Trichonephila clavipes]